MNTRGVRTIWEENSPDSLLDLSIRCLLRNPAILFYAIDVTRERRRGTRGASAHSRKKGTEKVTEHEDRISEKGPRLYERKTHSVYYEQNGARPPIHLRLHPHHQLPAEFCEKLLTMMHDEGFDLNDCVLTAFGNTSNSRIRSVHLRHSTVSDLGLKALLKHKIRSLDVVGCSQLTETSLDNLNHNCCDSLVELSFSGNLHPDCKNPNSIFPSHIAATSLDCEDRTPPSSTFSDLQHDTQCKQGILLADDERDGILVNDEKYHRENYSANDTNDIMDTDDELEIEDRISLKYPKRGYILNTPKLQRLCMHDLEITRGQSYFPTLFKSLTSLSHLDLSGCGHRDGMDAFKWLPKYLKNSLVYLVLHNVGEIDTEAIRNIIKLKRLRHLDISKVPDKVDEDHFSNPNSILKMIVEGLPDLCSLDISGTNLAGNGVYEQSAEEVRRRNSSRSTDHSQNEPGQDGDVEMTVGQGEMSDREEMPQCDIVGLISRVHKPLDFLGLYKCVYEPNHRAHIPAKQVSGDKDEAQLLVAGQHYLNRPVFLESILNDLFNNFKYQESKNIQASLDIILLSMNRYPGETAIQRAGSACLYYVVKDEPKDKINAKVKQKILATLLNAMFFHKDDVDMMRNGCLTLCQFDIPQDVIFDYERLVEILLYIVSAYDQASGNFVQRAGICLLNSLACQVEGRRKLLVGDLGAMEKMLELIRERLKSKTCDEVLETAWSTMWNVTDETPINCERFLDGGGMQLFLQCKEEFPRAHSLLRNMMGLLGNVAEVPNLRHKLMTQAFVTEFAMLLDSSLDGIEVSYNAAGVLAHMASDGPETWNIEEPTRQDVLSRMVKAIESWRLNTKRNINYRSFEPIIRLLRVSHTPQCQHWAVWALANLTKVDSDKYCSLVEQEGGLDLLEEIINSNVPILPYQRVIELASAVRDNVTKSKERKRSKSEDRNHGDDSGWVSADDDSEDGLDLDG